VVHAELAFGPAGPVVIELTPRPGGGPVPHMLRAATGASLLACAADLALGRAADGAVATRAAGFRILRASEPGRIARFGAVGELPAGVQLRLTADVGDRVRLPPDSFVNPLGWVVAEGDNRESVLSALDDACRQVRLRLVAPHGPASVWALARRVGRPRYRQRLVDRIRAGTP
jgi:biotin carboxylase